METRLCRFCKEQIHEYHGNNWHHPECVEKDRKRRSKKRYERQQLKLDPYWLNEKIIRELYGQHGKLVEMEPALLTKMGFVFALFKEKRQLNDYTVFVMHDHGFSLLKNKKVILWKL